MADSRSTSDFVSVTSAKPCICCGKGDWCRRSPDDLVIECHRKGQADCPPGYVFRKTTKDGFSIFRKESSRDGDTRRSDSPPKQTPRRVWPLPDDFAKRIRGRHVGTWFYQSAEGSDVLAVVRIDVPHGEKTIRPLHKVAGGWVVGDPPGKLPLYRIGEIKDASRVYVVEGEKSVDAARSLGLVVTTSAHGAKSADKTDWSPLTCSEVVILPDNDNAGRSYAETVAGIIGRLNPTATIKIVMLPDLPEHGDIVEFIAARRDQSKESIRAEINSLVEGTPAFSREPAEQVGEETGDTGRRSQADLVAELAVDVELFHTPGSEGEAFASIMVRGHRETWPVKSSAFRQWLSHQYWKRWNKAPNSQAMTDGLSVVKGRALFDSPEQNIHIRICRLGNSIWLDLCNDTWQAVEITTEGWLVHDHPPVRFVRRKGMLPLTTPLHGGSISELRPFVNMPDEPTWVLYVSWLVAAFRPGRPFVVLVVNGEQGSAKSTAGRVARLLIDPNKTPLRRPPKEDRDLMIAANNSWIVAYDNLSGLPPWLSDSLCSLATGGGFATRELYTDDEEKLFDAIRPVILNGISDVATRADLLDRSINLFLPSIPEEERRDEESFWPEFEAVRPNVLGALLDAVSTALQNERGVKLPFAPRMADFARWATAAEPAFGWETGTVLRAYSDNRGDTTYAAIESAIIGPPILGLMHCRDHWHGTAKELLTELEDHHTDEKTRNNKDWPKSPRKLGGELRRLAPDLRRVGISVIIGAHTRRGTPIALENTRKRSSQPSPSSPHSVRQGVTRDDVVCGFAETSSQRVATSSHAGPTSSPPNPIFEAVARVGDGRDDGDDVFPPISNHDNGDGDVVEISG
jgi:hypothetical protein